MTRTPGRSAGSGCSRRSSSRRWRRRYSSSPSRASAKYLADATGAQFLGRAAPLAHALEALERGSQALPMTVNPATASLYAVNPLARQGVATLFMTHPPIAERVRRLRALDYDQTVRPAA